MSHKVIDGWRAIIEGTGNSEEPGKKYRITIAGHYVMFDTYGNMKKVVSGESITDEQSLKNVRFDVDKAIESGIMEIEELE